MAGLSPGAVRAALGQYHALAAQRNQQAAQRQATRAANVRAVTGGIGAVAGGLQAYGAEQKALAGLKAFGATLGIPEDDPAWESPEAAKVRISDAVAQRNATTQRTQQLNDRADSQTHAERMVGMQQDFARTQRADGWAREDAKTQEAHEAARVQEEGDAAALRDILQPEGMEADGYEKGPNGIIAPRWKPVIPSIDTVRSRVASGRKVGGGAVGAFSPDVVRAAERMARAPANPMDAEAAEADIAAKRARAARDIAIAGKASSVPPTSDAERALAEQRRAAAEKLRADADRTRSGGGAGIERELDDARSAVAAARSKLTRIELIGMDPEKSALPEYATAKKLAKDALADAERVYREAKGGAGGPATPGGSAGAGYDGRHPSGLKPSEVAELTAGGYVWDDAVGGWLPPEDEDGE